MSGEEDTLQESLSGSADRFERLAHTGDLREIQALLFEEVAALRRVTLQRRAGWERTLHQFSGRVASLEAQLDHSRREAALDPLTHVANRREFERTCREWLQPGRPTFVMAMVDVDNFKNINDLHGHDVGDRVLVTVAATLDRSVRAGDVVGRLGGDEFAVAASGLTIAQAENRFATIGRAVRDACAALGVEGLSGSISIGLSESAAGDTLDSLQKRADNALYQAKRAGKGRVSSLSSPFIRDLLKGRKVTRP
jgi:diguanylate cyclase (GGDEF)-like protein